MNLEKLLVSFLGLLDVMAGAAQHSAARKVASNGSAQEAYQSKREVFLLRDTFLSYRLANYLYIVEKSHE